MKINTLIAFLLCLSSAFAQNGGPVDRLVEELSQQFDDEANYHTLIEDLNELYENPIDLLKADKKDLEKLHILSPKQIGLILNYRDKTKLISLYELQTLPDLDLKTLELILPFLTLNQRPDWIRKGIKPVHYLMVRYDLDIETKKGFKFIDSTRAYAGDPAHWILRYRLNYPKQLSIGLNLEKDPGERVHWDMKRNYYGVGHINFHAQVWRKNLSLILGDYRLQFGQALIIGGAGFQLGKSAAPILGIKRNGVGIKPHNSLTEYGYFKGLALTYHKAQIKTTIFLSSRNRDSGSFTLNGKKYYNLRNTGLHRTVSEYNGRNQVREWIYGLNINYETSSGFQVGFNILQTHYSRPVSKTPSPYSQFYFRGKSLGGLSVYWDYTYKNINWFGEIALDPLHRSIAWLTGALLNLSHQLELAIHWRNFPKNFHSFYGNAFAEKKAQHNEQGLYLGIQCKVSNRHKLAIYADQYRYPWLRNGHGSPSYGWEFGLAWQARLARADLSMRYSRNQELDNNNVVAVTRQVSITNADRIRIGIQKNINSSILLKWQIMGSRVESSGNLSRGLLMAQDIQFNNMGKISFKTRFCLFDTEDSDNRQYIYENDVLYGFSIPSFSGTGIRYLALLRFRFNHKISAWMRWSATHYRDRNLIGSGNDEIEGNRRQQLKIQLRYRF